MTVTITLPPPAPSRTNDTPSDFADKADAFVAWQVAARDEQNAQNVENNSLNASAQTASLAAQGAANYKGEYVSATAYTLGQSVSYLGRVYVAKKSNTGITPVDGNDWLIIGNGDVYLTQAQTLTNKTLGSGTVITAGSINGATIGGTTPAAGAFTTLAASGAATLSGNTTLGSTLTVNGTVGNTGQVLASRGAGQSPAWANAEAFVQIGVLTTTSGSTQTLSGLNLSTFKFLRLVVSRVSHNSGSSRALTFNSITGPQFTATAGAGSFFYGMVEIDITNNGTFSASVHAANVAGLVGDTTGAYAGETGITNASTSVTVGITGGSFDNGQIVIYGLR